MPSAQNSQLALALDRKATKKRDIERLVPIAQELARKAGQYGVTISDVRLAAVQRGILTGEETGRQLAYLGAVMRVAKLSATTLTRRSTIEKSHGNRHTVWVDPSAHAEAHTFTRAIA